MLQNLNEMIQTTKASLSISGITFAAGIAAIADIVPIFTAVAGLVLAIFTIISNKRKIKRDEDRAQELHELKKRLMEKELNE